MRALLAGLALLALVGCASTTEPKGRAGADGDGADRGRGGGHHGAVLALPWCRADNPECNAAIRTYALAVTAYALALAAVRVEPSPLNVLLALLAAAVVVNETATSATTAPIR